MDPPVYNPVIPYSGFINGGFRPGRMVRISGNVPFQAHGFSISLLCGHSSTMSDVGLLINPRFLENSMVFNAKNMGHWGHEERNSQLPIGRGKDFEIIILCEHNCYKIAVNGKHYTQFNHRLPPERVTALGIDGDITVSFFRFEGQSSHTPPPPSPSPQPVNPVLQNGGLHPPPYSIPGFTVATPMTLAPPQPAYQQMPQPVLMVTPPSPNCVPGMMYTPAPNGLSYPPSPIPRRAHPPPPAQPTYTVPLMTYPVPGNQDSSSIAGVPPMAKYGMGGYIDEKALKKQTKKDKKYKEKFEKEEKKRQKKLLKSK